MFRSTFCHNWGLKHAPKCIWLLTLYSISVSNNKSTLSWPGLQFTKNGHREITMDYFSSRGCFFSLSINLQTKLFILPFSSITLSTRDGENPIPIKDDLKLLPDELAMFSWNHRIKLSICESKPPLVYAVW